MGIYDELGGTFSAVFLEEKNFFFKAQWPKVFRTCTENLLYWQLYCWHYFILKLLCTSPLPTSEIPHKWSDEIYFWNATGLQSTGCYSFSKSPGIIGSKTAGYLRICHCRLSCVQGSFRVTVFSTTPTCKKKKCKSVTFFSLWRKHPFSSFQMCL